MMGEILEGETYDLNIKAKNMRGEGIGMLNDTVVFVKNAKTRIGKAYKIRITKMHRTFAYAEMIDENSKYFIGNGSLIIQ
ncbi:MAG: TRAM domain-containing protein [Candidatus Micrarchaeales archaeon]|jgi:predicted RNA-binding protein with TRAM domain